MVISFKLSRPGRRFHPPPPQPPPSAAADETPRTTAAATGGGVGGGCGGAASEEPPPPHPWEDNMLRFDDGIAAQCYIRDKNETGPIELDLEPSFALNLFPDGFSIGELSKGMLLLMIGDDPKKRPYDRASKALFSAIEYGCLPGDILDAIPCKYLNGNIVCEVRDYRSCMSNDSDSSGDDFPKVNRVALRLSTEYVVRDLLSIMDGSWTYQDQLLAESMIIKALQPRLNLDPTPCLARLCNSVVKKLDLGLHKRRYAWKPLDLSQSKDAFLLDVSSNAFLENAKSKECNVYEGAAVCNPQNAISEGMPSGVLNSSSSLQINSNMETIESDPDNTLRGSSTLRDSSAFHYRDHSASNICDAGHLLQIHEQEAQVTISCADARKNRQLRQESRRKTVLPQKRKKPSNLLPQSLEGQKCLELKSYDMLLDKTARRRPQNYSDFCQDSIGTSIKEDIINLATLKELPVEVTNDQTTDNENMRVQQQKPLSMVTTNHPLFYFSNNNASAEKFPDKDISSQITIHEGSQASFVDLNNFGVGEVRNGKRSLIATCSPSSKKAAAELLKDKAVPSRTASKRKVSENSTVSLMKQNNLTVKKQKIVDVQIEPASESTSSEESATIGGTCYPAEELCMQHPLDTTTDPDVEKILSEVIMTTQRHGLNEKMAKFDDLKSKRPLSCCSLPPFQFFQPENAEECKHLGAEVNVSNYLIGRSRNARETRMLVFDRVEYFFSCIVNESRCTLCLVKSEEPDDHQVGVIMIFEDEHFHIATLPTSNHADKFVAQFIVLMERDDYRLVKDQMLCSSSSTNVAHCNNLVYSGYPEISQHISPLPTLLSSTFSKQVEGVSDLAYLTKEDPQCQRLSPVVAKSLLISKNKDVGHVLPKSPLEVQAKFLQQESLQQLFLQQSPTLGSMETSFLSSSHVGQQLHNMRNPQARGPPFASRMHLMNHGTPVNFSLHNSGIALDKFPSVQASRGVDIDQSQCRGNLPSVHEWPIMNSSTKNCNLCHQSCAQRDGKVHQVDLPAVAQETKFPLLRAGRSILLSVSHPVGSPQMSCQTSNSDASVTSSPVETPIPLKKSSRGKDGVGV